MKKTLTLSDDQKEGLSQWMYEINTAKMATELLEGIRWGTTTKCPFCNSQNVKRRYRFPYWRCYGECKKDFTVKTGTLFENSNMPLDKWLIAIYLVVIEKINSPNLLARECAITTKTSRLLIKNIKNITGNSLNLWECIFKDKQI